MSRLAQFVLTLAVVALGPCVAHQALAQPQLEEPSGGSISDDARRALRQALYEEVPLLGEMAWAPRPSDVAYAQLRELAARFPTVAAVQKYLGHAALAAGDAAAAERALQSAASAAQNASWALEELAAFYRLQNRPRDELAALDRQAQALRKDLRSSARRQELARLVQRQRELAEAAGLAGVPARYARQLIELNPADPSYLRRYLDALVAHGQGRRALTEAARYRTRFPDELRYFAALEAGLAEARRDSEGAQAVYRKIFTATPLPLRGDPSGLYQDYFALVRRLGRERELRRSLLAKARAGTLNASELTLLVELHVAQGDTDAASKLLAAQPTTDTAADLLLRGRLHLLLAQPERAAPLLYAAQLRATVPAARAAALAELGLALVDQSLGRTALTPLAPLSGFHPRHLASGPAVGGGLAALLFPGAGGDREADLDRVQAVRGNLERATFVLGELAKLAPRSDRVADLLVALVDAYESYREHPVVARLAQQFGRDFPRHPRYFDVLRRGCQARRHQRPADGAGCYVRLLDEAYARGETGAYETTLAELIGARTRQADSAKETAAARAEALKRYRAELGKHPDDAWLYDQFLDYLQKHNLFDEELRVYEEGVRRFGGSDWADRLARWQLRRRGEAAFRDVLGHLLDGWSDVATAGDSLDHLVRYDYRSATADTSRFYETIYRRALERFPFDVRFVHKLLNFYDHFPRRFASQASALVKRYALAAPELLTRLLQERSAAGVLVADVRAIGRGQNLGETTLAAEALVFLSRQEEAAPLLETLTRSFPGDRALARRHAALVRALAPAPRDAAAQAAAILEQLTTRYPGDESLYIEIGDYFAEAGRLDEAAKRYARIIALHPGDLDAHLRLASIQWDWFQYDAAIQTIAQARKRSGNPLAFADKLGALYEAKRDLPRAIAEYIRLAASAERLDRPASHSSDSGEEFAEGDGERSTAPADAGLARLVQLARSKARAALIRSGFASALKPDLAHADGSVILAAASYWARLGEPDTRATLLGDAAQATDDTRLLDRIVALTGQSEQAQDQRVLIAALGRRAALSRGAPSDVYPLADALTSSGDTAGAERALRELIVRLDSEGNDERDEAVSARVALAELLWRDPARRQDAVAIRREAALRAPGGRQEDLLLSLLDWRRSLGQLAEAETEARMLAEQHPALARFTRPLVDVLIARGQPEQAIAQGKSALASVAALALSDAERRARSADLRRLLIDLLRELKRPRDAVDQWIELINMNPGDSDEIVALADYAAQHDLSAHVLDYYRRTAARASRDVRWPQVLAALSEQGGDPAAVAAQLNDALAIAPERTDLWRRRAEALLRAGDPAAAAITWHRLWELDDHAPQWATAEASAQARTGDHRAALVTLKSALPQPRTTVSPWLEGAVVLEDAGLVEEAWQLGGEALAQAAAAPDEILLSRGDAASYARIAVRAGHGVAALTALEQLAQAARTAAQTEGAGEPWRAQATADAAQDALADALPRAVAAYADDAGMQAFTAALVAPPPAGVSDDIIDRRAAMALAAERPDVARTLWRRGAALPGDSGLTFARKLVESLVAAQLHGELIALLEQAKSDQPWSEQAEFVLALADAHHALGHTADEERALARSLTRRATERDSASIARFTGYDATLARYLTLLDRRNATVELRQLAERGTEGAAQIADFLLARGRIDLGLVALAALSRQENTLWRDAKQGEALLALGGHGPQATAALARILAGSGAVAPIAQVLGKAPDPRAALVGKRWYRYAARYGEALRQAGRRAEALRFAAAPVEQAPRQVAAYVAHGDALLRMGETQAAIATYERALTLDPGAQSAIDHLARAYVRAGDKPKALSVWDRLLMPADSPAAQRKRFELVLAAGLGDEARAAYGRYLAATWPSQRAGQLDDLRQLARSHPAPLDDSVWQQFLKTLCEQTNRGDLALLGALVGLDDPEQGLLAPAAREPYLRAGLARARGAEEIRWRQALLGWAEAPGRNRPELGAEIVQPVLMQARSAGQPAPAWAMLAMTRVRFEQKQADRAVAALLAWLPTQDDETYQHAAQLLDALRAPDAAWQVRLARAERRVTPQQRSTADELALADALWHLGRKDRAEAVLRRTAFSRLDETDAYRGAAEIAENAKLEPLARDIRQRLAQLAPLDGHNRARLARLLWRKGARAQAVELAATLLGDRRVERSARIAAAELLGDMAASRVVEAERAAQRAAAQLASPDEPTLLAAALVSRTLVRLKDRLGELQAPRATLLRLARDALERNRFSEAAELFTRLRALGEREPRDAQFAAERGAGHPHAALLLLDTEETDEWRSALEHGSSEARLAELVRTARERPPWNVDGTRAADVIQLGRTALGTARDVDDLPRAAFLAALVAALDPSTDARRQADTTLHELLARQQRAQRRFVTPDLDTLLELEDLP